MKKKMVYVWLVLALVCLGYYLTCVWYAGAGSSFIFIWLIGTLFFGAVFGVHMAAREGLIVLPVWFVRAFMAFMATGITVFIILEGLIISSMSADTGEDCSYMIVLGCQIRGRQLTKSLRNRLDTAYDYAAAHPDTVIIVSGGQGPGEELSEAQAMYEYLTARGIKPERIIQENQSYNTDQNMRNSVKFIDDPTARVGIVTSNFHVFRARMLARAKGLTNTSGIASPSDNVLFVNYMVREAIGIIKDLAVGNFW